jgi:hypothetical protein
VEKAHHPSRSDSTKKGECEMVTLNIPMFLGLKTTCRILDCNFSEAKTLLSIGKLSGGKTVDGLKIETQSICLLLGIRELQKKSFLWQKSK